MVDRTKPIYQSGIPGLDSETLTNNKEEAEAKREKYEKETAIENKRRYAKIPKASPSFKISVDEALKKTSKK